MPHQLPEVCTYGQVPSEYGDGHYGVCDRENIRGCVSNKRAVHATPVSIDDGFCPPDQKPAKDCSPNV